ncbi:unnamed protein product [Caenorhabditis auriculariae]|uniref:DNA replication complex GINS protein SLD5 n=1 Tax=Caenorhabditis auriculariae TaxID=2777116 RepID=A0A8S1H4A8_9PELO|nr:unnamed protein product [Caenorhabditis auriculariae]
MAEPSTASQSTDDEEFLTPTEVIRRMTVAWQNELAAPCLMPTEMDLVDILLDQIKGMEENIARQQEKVQLKISLHRMELQRISYMTSDYVRARLLKIEANPRRVLAEHERRVAEGLSALLDDNELEFTKNFVNAEAQLLGKTVLEKSRFLREDLEIECVYVKVVEEDVGEIVLQDNLDPNSEHVIALNKDEIHLIPFVPIRHLVEQGKLQLL